jgi:hypothetical protein
MALEGLFEKFRMQLGRVRWRIDLSCIVRSRREIPGYLKVERKEEFINDCVESH